MTDMNLGQRGVSPGPSSQPQTQLYDPPGSNPGGPGGGVMHLGSLADKLRLAASKGQTDKVEDLLKAGATFSPDRDGRTALHYAAQNGYGETCKLLIEKGCDLDAQDAMGYTALLRGCSQGLLDVVRICLEGGCNVDFADEHGNTALHEAAWHGFSKTLEMLIKYNANVFRTNKSGFTALHLAAQNGHNESSRVLLYGGINPDLQNNYGDTALHTAARYGHAGVTRILISAKCKLNIQNKNGDTALHISAALKRRKIAKILVESHVADVHVVNKQNETAMDVARRKEHPEIILIITSLSRPHSTGPRQREFPGVTFKDDIDIDDGPVVCADDEPPLKPEKQEKEKGRFFPFFKKKKKDKEKEKTTQPATAGTQVKKPVAPSRVQPIPSKPVAGFFSQYVPRHGTQYYRDLAGNIKQGPIGYSPVCQCGPTFSRLEKSLHETRDHLYDHIDASHQVLKDRIQQLDQRTSQQAHSLDHLTRERLEAERRACQAALDQRLLQERHRTQYVMDSYNEGLQDWLEDKLATYGHCLDHHHDDLALPPRNLFTDVHLGPDGGRLFRSRSDETLSVSDYSGKGRKKQFYESRKAAMEQIRGWNVPSMAKDSSKKREHGRSADELGKREGRVSERNNNVSVSNRNIAKVTSSGNITKGVSSGHVNVTIADIHVKAQDRRADGASPRFEGSPGGDVGGLRPHDHHDGQHVYSSSRGVGSTFTGRQTPVQTYGAITKPRPHAHFQHGQAQSALQSQSALQTQSWQARSHGNIASSQPVPVAGMAAQSSHPSGSNPPLRGILRSTGEDGQPRYTSYNSPYRHPNLDERGPPGISELTTSAPGGREGPLSHDAGSTGWAGSVPAYSNQQHNPLYGTTQSVRDLAQNFTNTHNHEASTPDSGTDASRFRPRTKSTDTILDGADAVSGSRYRSRSEERMLDAAEGARPLRSPGPKGDYSGYVTDSGVRNSPYPNYFPYKQTPSDRNSGYVTDSNTRSSSYERNSARPVSGDRSSGNTPTQMENHRPTSAERTSGYYTDSDLKHSAVQSGAHSAGPPQSSSYRGANYRQQEPQPQRLPATRYRVLPPLPPSVPGDQRYTVSPNIKQGAVNPPAHAASSTVNSTIGNTHTGVNSANRFVNSSITHHPGGASYSPRKAENSITNFQAYDHSVHIANRDSRQGDSPREAYGGSVSQAAKDRLLPPYRSTLGLYGNTVKSGANTNSQSSHALQPVRNTNSKSESNLAKESDTTTGKNVSQGVSSPRPLSQHYSKSCLQHDDYSYSPVYNNGGSKEDSTCSSNQDSGYSSRMVGGVQGGGGRSGESGTPSSSFSTDHSVSLGPPSNTSSPYMYMGGNSYSDYVPMGGNSSEQRGGYTSDYQPGRGNSSYSTHQQNETVRRGSVNPYSSSDHSHGVALAAGKLGSDYQRVPVGSVPPSSQQQTNGPSAGANLQNQVQGWYQRKLLEAAERLRNSDQYSRPDPNYGSYTTVPIHYDPVHGSDV